MKLEGHMHNTNSSSFFAINHDDNHKFTFKSARATECKYACKRLWVYVCIKIEGYIHFPKTSGWCVVPHFDWQEFQIHFMICK